MARNYKKEYENFHSRPEERKKRSKRVLARRKVAKTTNVAGKDVDHKKPLRSGGGNSKSNLRVSSKSSNRSRNGAKKGLKKYGNGKRGKKT